MKLPQRLYKTLVSHRITRRPCRRALQKLKQLLGYQDPYETLGRIVGRYRPVAMIDVGSFNGDTIQRLLDEGISPIYGFEPASASFKELCERFQRESRVSVFNLALGSHCGRAELHCNHNPETNSVLESSAVGIGSFPHHMRRVGSETVVVETLDHWCDENVPTETLVIKADMQGAEGHLVLGGAEAFRSRVIAFYAEAQILPNYQGQTDFFELHELLVNAFDFRLHNIYPCMLNQHGEAVQLDAMWIRRGLAI